jgi:hypothetical protein
MTDNQFNTLVILLTEIKDVLQKNQQSQPQTKITVVGNKPQTGVTPKAKGFNPTDSFEF